MTESETAETRGEKKTDTGISATNRVYRKTKLAAVLIIPFLLTAWVILYLFPEETEALFAWPVDPTLSARIMGAGYLSGAYFFLRVVTAHSWQTIRRGFIPVAIFAVWMLVTTLIHWDRFSHGHISFITWVAVYAVAPLLILYVWHRNRSQDPGTPQGHDTHIPSWMRGAMGVFGGAMLLLAIVFFLNPAWMINIWPWTVTPLTARSLLGFFLIPAATFILLALDPRWSAHRIIIQGKIIGMALIMIASALSWPDFFPANPAAWTFVGSGLLVMLGLFEYYRIMEIRSEQSLEKPRIR
jgi:hypothetical protein